MFFLSALALLIWLYLLLGHGRFWQSGPELPPARPPVPPDVAIPDLAIPDVAIPDVAIVVPARDEAAVIGPRSAPCWPRTIPARSASSWSMTAAPTAPAPSRATSAIRA